MSWFESSQAESAFHKITKAKHLSYEQEQELAARIADGDDEAVQELALANVRFIMSMAYKAKSSTASADDLFQEAFYQTMVAASRFRPGYGKFITYAVWYARHGMQLHIRGARTIRMSAQAAEKSSKILAEIEEYQMDHGGGSPTPEYVADRLGIRPELVRRYMAVMRPDIRLDKLLGSAGSRHETPYHDLVGEDLGYWYNPVLDPIDKASAEKALSALDKFPKMQRAVRRRLWDDARFEDIAAEEGISRQAVEHRFRNGVAKMRQAMGVKRA